MANTEEATKAAASIIEGRLSDRPELREKYGSNALPLLGLALYIQQGDIDSLAAEALTDGGNDKKIDLCYIDRSTGYAAIAQGYASQTWEKQSADSNKATDLISAVGWLFAGDMAQVPEKLRDTVKELREAIAENEINRIELLYIHNCQESENIKAELRTAVQVASKLLADHPIAIAAQELGLQTLDNLCLASESRIFVQAEAVIPAANVIEERGGVWRSIVASVQGDWLHDLNRIHGPSLFRANYREFLGIRRSLRNINHGIRNSVQTDAENFWTYNNGITALVRKITVANDQYKVQDISIINGAQTTGSVGECTREQASKVKVLCRFIDCSDDSVLHNIIRFNNTQNAFRTADQRSNDPIQKRLAIAFAASGLTYIHRRSAAGNPKGSISAEGVAPLLCAFHGDPQTASRRRNDIFDSDSVFERVFPPSCRAEHVLLVHCLGAAIDEVKYTLKVRHSSGTATPTEERNYEVLKYSASKLFLLAVIGKVADEIMGRRIPDLYAWCFRPDEVKRGLGKLIFPWKEGVEVVLPLVGNVVGNNAYQVSRTFVTLPDIGAKVSAILNAAGDALTNRFAPLRDATEL